jgi:hypothetical protein
MIAEHIDDLRSGKLPKGKFLGKYMAKLNEIDRGNAIRYKRPQVIGEGKKADNNWLDYILKMTDEEFFWFKEAITV